MPIETELKFEVSDPAVFEQVASLNDIAGYALVDCGIVHIRDTAFDTVDNTLYHSGAVLRLREMCGERYLTFKAHAPSEGSYYRRIEEEASTEATVADINAGHLPGIPPVVQFRERFGEVSLSPRLTTDNNRHILLLVKNRVPRYELALDDVMFTGPRGVAHIREIEVEALMDIHDDLDNIGAWLAERFGLVKAGPSKFVQGMDLVGMVTR